MSTLRTVALLSHGELCVCHLEEALALSQPIVSRQLGILRTPRIVEDRSEGNWVHYRLLAQEDKDCRRQLKALVQAFPGRGVLRRGVETVVKIRGSGACP